MSVGSVMSASRDPAERSVFRDDRLLMVARRAKAWEMRCTRSVLHKSTRVPLMPPYAQDHTPVVPSRRCDGDMIASDERREAGGRAKPFDLVGSTAERNVTRLRAEPH